MRRAARADGNQKEIVEYIRKRYEATVAHTHMIGQGFPDIVIGYRGANYLVEIKDGSKSPSERALTKEESLWHAEWCGQVCIISSVKDVDEFFTRLT